MKRKPYIPLYKIEKYVYVQKLDEGLRLSDLMKNAGMSDFTVDWKQERNNLMKPENRIAKLILAEVNQDEDYVLFQFNTPSTDKYPDDYRHKATSPKDNFKLVGLPSKIYTMEIKILKFFEWLDTTPNDIENKDIEDVLEVADIQVFCNCPSQNWQGMAYNLTTFDASIYPQPIPDPVWKKHHNSDNLLCKHLGGLVNSVKFFIPQMRQKLKKELGLTR